MIIRVQPFCTAAEHACTPAEGLSDRDGVRNLRKGQARGDLCSLKRGAIAATSEDYPHVIRTPKYDQRRPVCVRWMISVHSRGLRREWSPRASQGEYHRHEAREAVRGQRGPRLGRPRCRSAPQTPPEQGAPHRHSRGWPSGGRAGVGGAGERGLGRRLVYVMQGWNWQRIIRFVVE